MPVTYPSPLLLPSTGEDDDDPLTYCVPMPDDDDLLALVLITTWTARTGRLLPIGVPPAELTEQQLIDFWADDQLPTHYETAPSSRRPTLTRQP